MHTTDEVFGITRAVPLNYVERPAVDGKFVDNLTRQKHLVVYGSSKQGKTNLRKHCLTDSDSITVTCGSRWSLGDLHAAILKAAGYEVMLSSTRTSTGEAKLQASFTGKLFGSGIELGAEKGAGGASEETTRPLEIDPQDVNDVIQALADVGFDKYIVLEDFHYLSTETQKDFAVALKAFHENSNFCFIIVGVWLDENRLIVYNGDLAGRVVPVNADEWSVDELHRVVTKGAELLNVEFESKFATELVVSSGGSVAVVQDACNRACKEAGVYQMMEHLTVVGPGQVPKDLVRDVVNEQGGRYISFLNQFAEGFGTTELGMYRWLLYVVITSDLAVLEGGLRLRDISNSLRENHPRGEGLNVGNITQALKSCAALQVGKNIKPIILDYDETNRQLRVVDRGFLIWLQNQDRNELASSLGLDPAILSG